MHVCALESLTGSVLGGSVYIFHSVCLVSVCVLISGYSETWTLNNFTSNTVYLWLCCEIEFHSSENVEFWLFVDEIELDVTNLHFILKQHASNTHRDVGTEFNFECLENYQNSGTLTSQIHPRLQNQMTQERYQLTGKPLTTDNLGNMLLCAKTPLEKCWK